MNSLKDQKKVAQIHAKVLKVSVKAFGVYSAVWGAATPTLIFPTSYFRRPSRTILSPKNKSEN